MKQLGLFGNRILVTGGRDYKDRDTVFKYLDLIHNRYSIGVLIHGCARGADSLAAEWAVARGVAQERYPVTDEEWTRIGPSAGHRRNERMVDRGDPDFVLAFPGGDGTAGCVEYARLKKIGIAFVLDDGSWMVPF